MVVVRWTPWTRWTVQVVVPLVVHGGACHSMWWGGVQLWHGGGGGGGVAMVVVAAVGVSGTHTALHCPLHARGMMAAEHATLS